MAHDHDHHHGSVRLLFALTLTGGFMVAEVVGGLLSGSLALLADAGHMLTDTVSLALAWLATRISHRPADRLRSYGYHRMQILAAFANGVFFIFLVGWIGVEAFQRLLDPQPILGGLMMWVAVLGLLVNVVAFAVLHTGDHGNLNVRAAALHILGDLLGSVAAIVAAVVILFTGWTPIDPLLSILVALLILNAAWRIVRESGHILLEGTPPQVDVETVTGTLHREIPELLDVHHLHIWSLTPDRTLLTMHVKVEPEADIAGLLARIKDVLAENFAIRHSTVQIEPGDCVDD